MEVTSRFRRRAFWSVAFLLLLVFIQSGWALRLELAGIGLYQRVCSPVVSQVVTCRFEPTCSHYAVEVLQRSGFWAGNLRITLRLLHCSPFGIAFDWVAGWAGST